MLSFKQSIIICAALMLAGVVLSLAYMAVISPKGVRQPQFEHAHFRIQLIVQGQPVNFGSQEFQDTYDGACTESVADEPFHFHDNKDQLVHVHWKGMTGGLLLKNYGWNMVGGIDSLLGYRFDTIIPQRVPIFGDVLPALPSDTSIWVYTGNETAWQVRKTSEFLWENIETFFDTPSLVSSHKGADITSGMFAKAKAHSVLAEQVSTYKEADGILATQQQELERINNLLGNVVIFVQNDPPSQSAVQERFNNLVPLDGQTCAG